MLYADFINWNKYQPKGTIQRQKQHLVYLTDYSSQGVKRLYVLLFENNDHRTVRVGYFLPKVKIKDCNVMIDGKYSFDLPVKNDLRTYVITRIITTCQGNYYAASCLLDYAYIKQYYKMIAITTRAGC